MIEEFNNIPKNSLARLRVCGKWINATDVYKDEDIARCLGIVRRGGDYDIVNWDYYDVLKRVGIRPSLVNMIDLHNYIVAGGL